MSERHSTTHDGFCGSVCTLEIARTVAYEDRRYSIEFSAGHVNGAVTTKLTTDDSKIRVRLGELATLFRQAILGDAPRMREKQT